MNPKEWKFLLGCIESFSRHAYMRGFDDGSKGKQLISDGFKPSKATELRLKKLLNDQSKSR